MSNSEGGRQRESIQVLLDIGPAVHQGAGLSRYAERLASHLLQDRSEHLDLSLFYNAHSGHIPPATLSAAPTKTVSMGQYRWRLSSLTSQLTRRPMRRIDWPPASNRRNLLPVYHATEHLLPNLRCPSVMTVHDLIFERYPEHHTLRNRAFLKLAMPAFVRAADAIIAVSHHTRSDLIELYRCQPEKIHVIYEGIDADFRPAVETDVNQVRARYGLHQRPYLFMMGTLEPRKNHATALQALARLKAVGYPHQLVLAGGHGWLFEPVRELVEQLGLDNDVAFTGYVPQEHVPPLYTGADCVLMPSLYEGFGFPVLEAMACGTPVVCSDASSLPEVAGDAALLVAPTDDKALASSVQRILDDADLAAALRERGLRRAARFKWSECARQTADLYAELSTT